MYRPGRESNDGGLILRAFFALAFENELEYHYRYVRINSSDDQATADINLVGFWPVPPEFNCGRTRIDQQSVNYIYVRHGAERAIR